MATFNGTIRIVPKVGNRQFADKIALMKDRLLNLQPALNLIGRSFGVIEAMKFNAEGPGWEPLKQSTIDRRSYAGTGSEILNATGALRASFASLGAAGSHYDPGPNSITMGSSIPYAEYHQAGFKDRGGGSVTARPPVNITPEIAAAWWTILSVYISTGAAVSAKIPSI